MSRQAIASFVREVEEQAGRILDPKVLGDAVSESVRRLFAGSFFLDDRHQRTSPDGFSRHVVHQAPGSRVVVVSCAWLPQQSTSVHDHGTWGVIAAISNRVVVTSYRRADDGTTPGFASLSEVSRLLVSDASIAVVRPGEEEIHRIENPFKEPAVTLHVYGADAPGQHVFDPRVKMISDLPPEAGVFAV